MEEKAENERIEKEVEKQMEYSHMPRRYVKFTIKFKKFWMWLMLIGVISTVALGTISYIILDNN